MCNTCCNLHHHITKYWTTKARLLYIVLSNKSYIKRFFFHFPPFHLLQRETGSELTSSLLITALVRQLRRTSRARSHCGSYYDPVWRRETELRLNREEAERATSWRSCKKSDRRWSVNRSRGRFRLTPWCRTGRTKRGRDGSTKVNAGTEIRYRRWRRRNMSAENLQVNYYIIYTYTSNMNTIMIPCLDE